MVNKLERIQNKFNEKLNNFFINSRPSQRKRLKEGVVLVISVFPLNIKYCRYFKVTINNHQLKTALQHLVINLSDSLSTGGRGQTTGGVVKNHISNKPTSQSFLNNISSFFLSHLKKQKISLETSYKGGWKAEKFSILINNINNNIACLHESSLYMYTSLLEW